MGRSSGGVDDHFAGLYDEQPEHDVTVGAFALDRFEATVGRFRAFVSDYEDWRVSGNPTTGAGAHPLIANSGWGAGGGEWTLPASRAELEEGLFCDFDWEVWTSTPLLNESYPMNCLTWQVAFAFCIWDEGRLPTEAEREYVAAGGAENRLYPWGSEYPVDGEYAVSVFVSEGAGVADIVKQMEADGQEVPRDAFGHVKLDAVNPGKYFAEQFSKKIGAEKVMVQKSGYYSRAAAASDEDLRLIKSCVDLAVECALRHEGGVIGHDEDRNNILRAIEFERIKGGKPFDTSLEWFDELLGLIGQPKGAPATVEH